MKKILTIILDGFGYREETHGNAPKLANMENYNQLWENYPHTTLYASEEPIGLKEGQFGNSEIGHMTIGAGRKINANNTLVDEFLEKEILENECFQKIIEDYNESKKPIHIMGMLSDKDVHSNINHTLKLFKLLVDNNIKDIYFHIITDGRDTAVDVSSEYIKMLEDKIKAYGVGKIATVCGRYYAMDRDKKWDRTKKYYDLVTRGIGISSIDPKKSIKSSYAKKITDEFINPLIINNEGLIKNGDTLIWMNFRSDRARQILSCLTDQKFEEFATYKMPDLNVYTLFPVDKKIKTNSFMPEQTINNPLGLYLSQLGLTQARIAETEKYAHVTYFFDGGIELELNKCKKVLIPSPKVDTYDLKPEMSAYEITDTLIKEIDNKYDLIVLNYANGDMVGHTGVYEKGIVAVETIDKCIEKLINNINLDEYTIIITADHGNCEQMINEDYSINTAHTTNLVPFIILDKSIKLKENHIGSLADIAPTILKIMNIDIPKEMNGDVLINE